MRQRPIKRRRDRNAQNHKGNRRANGPKQRLPALHVPQIARVHAEIARNEGQRQEDDSDDGEDDDSLVVAFGLEGNGLRGEEAGRLGLGFELIEVVEALGYGFEDEVEEGDGGFELAEGGVVLEEGVFDYV